MAAFIIASSTPNSSYSLGCALQSSRSAPRLAHLKHVGDHVGKASSAEGLPPQDGSITPESRHASMDARPSSLLPEVASAWEGSGRLWSRIPLCRSCAGALDQVALRFPKLKLEVLVGEADEAAKRATKMSAVVPLCMEKIT